MYLQRCPQPSAAEVLPGLSYGPFCQTTDLRQGTQTPGQLSLELWHHPVAFLATWIKQIWGIPLVSSTWLLLTIKVTLLKAEPSPSKSQNSGAPFPPGTSPHPSSWCSGKLACWAWFDIGIKQLFLCMCGGLGMERGWGMTRGAQPHSPNLLQLSKTPVIFPSTPLL